MHKDLELVCAALDELSSAILSSSTEERTLNIHGWNFPPITKHDLAFIPSRLANQIRNVGPDELDKEMVKAVQEMPTRIQTLQTNVIPYLANSNAAAAIPAYHMTLDFLRIQLEPILSWQVMNDSKAMPSKIANRIRSIIAALDEIAPNQEALSQQIKLIQDAVEAAESLPTDLQALKEAQAKITKISDDSVVILGKIIPREQEATDILVNITTKEKEAAQLVAQCEEAYRITTTKGLAASFDTRAGELKTSTRIWVVLLLLALAAGSFIGSHSADSIRTLLLSNDPKWAAILMNIVVAILTVGAPIWFAWVATKQIGQRFRLSEDYAFKASVAKAYEGYKKEAARIDPILEARLFSSALTRLDEAPLRLVESESHGSPWHELFASKQFQDAMQSVPELKDKFIEIAKDGWEKLTVK